MKAPGTRRLLGIIESGASIIGRDELLDMCGVLLPVQYIITGNRYWLLSFDVVSVGLSLLGEINRSNFEGVVSMRTVYI